MDQSDRYFNIKYQKVLTRKKVAEYLKLSKNDGGWTSSSPKGKDQVKLRSLVYNVFDVVYDVDDEIVRMFYVCIICKMERVNLKVEGNSKLARHEHYDDWLQRNKDDADGLDSKEEAENSEEEDDDESVYVLSSGPEAEEEDHEQSDDGQLASNIARPSTPNKSTATARPSAMNSAKGAGPNRGKYVKKPKLNEGQISSNGSTIKTRK